jgi:hypothetical protein
MARAVGAHQISAHGKAFKLHILFQAITRNVTLYVFDHPLDRSADGVPVGFVSEAKKPCCA